MEKRRVMKGNCIIETTRSKGRVTMKCKNLKRAPSAQEILDSVKHKIAYR